MCGCVGVCVCVCMCIDREKNMERKRERENVKVVTYPRFYVYLMSILYVDHCACHFFVHVMYSLLSTLSCILFFSFETADEDVST